MKQVVVRNGEITVAEVPAPAPRAGHVLVANAASVISSGTERASVQASSGSLPERALRNPALVVAALAHARRHGIRRTAQLARSVVGDDTVLGYSTAGVVLDTGGVAGLHPGQGVACAGAGRANHAEVVCVPANLTTPIPEGVSFQDAAFTTLGAIALQGVRRAQPTLGERVVVVGLGLLGLLTIQMLAANGCQVLGVEPSDGRRRRAADLGLDRAVAPSEAAGAVRAWSGGVGSDAAIVTAAGPSNEIVNSTAGLLRQKGRLVVVGDVGLGFERGPIYRREADILISTSYGPGRYDRTYEDLGADYPIGYVRWTENRNMEEFLRLVSAGQVKVGSLAGLELPVERAPEAYSAIRSASPPLAAVLTYDRERAPATGQAQVVRVSSSRRKPGGRHVRVALVGAGSFIRDVRVPDLRAQPGVSLDLVVSRTPTSATNVARSLGGARAAADWRAAVADEAIDLVVIGTRHDTHAEIAAAALEAGKAVLLEKPLGLTFEEIECVWTASAHNDRFAIGFNRPFAPLSQRLKEGVDEVSGPTQLTYRVNSPLPAEHWLNDPVEGGGRLIGEGCHMFDYANWLCGGPIRVFAQAPPVPSGVAMPEGANVTVAYADGSVATIVYSGLGSTSLPKERIEVLRGGRAWALDDYQRLTAFGPGVEPHVDTEPGKGHTEFVSALVAACRGERPFEPSIEAAWAAQAISFAATESIATGEAVSDGLAPPARK